MIYADMHCDTLTVCLDEGLNLGDCKLQTSLEKLRKSGCGVQCFAVFTDGDAAAAREKVNASLALFESFVGGCDFVMPVKSYRDLEICRKSGKVGAILTVENLGFTDGDLSALDGLYDSGVRMASLVWNTPNMYACPNLIFNGEIPDFDKRNNEGLTKLGAAAVERLDELKIIVDISHLSDGGAEQILKGRKIPIVASHSNATAVCGVSRNLTDGLIRKISDCGGIVGVNFCYDFLGGQPFESVLAHIKHIINIGGEGCVAFGSDFDGIPPYPEIPDCTAMPKIFSYLEGGLSPRVLEKLAYKNFGRVFKAICG